MFFTLVVTSFPDCFFKSVFPEHIEIVSVMSENLLDSDVCKSHTYSLQDVIRQYSTFCQYYTLLVTIFVENRKDTSLLSPFALKDSIFSLLGTLKYRMCVVELLMEAG